MSQSENFMVTYSQVVISLELLVMGYELCIMNCAFSIKLLLFLQHRVVHHNSVVFAHEFLDGFARRNGCDTSVNSVVAGVAAPPLLFKTLVGLIYLVFFVCRDCGTKRTS